MYCKRKKNQTQLYLLGASNEKVYLIETKEWNEKKLNQVMDYM